MSSLAIFVSTFSPNVYLLMVGLLFLPLPLSPSYSCCPQISYGVLGGLGLGLMYVPAVTAVGYWFEKKRSLVTGGLLILILLMLLILILLLLLPLSHQVSRPVAPASAQSSSPLWWPSYWK